MEIKEILSKEDIEEIYKDIYAESEYRKMAEKFNKFKMNGNYTQAMLMSKKMKDYEIGVFEGIARRRINAKKIAGDWVSVMPEEERKQLSILSYAVYMLSDVLEAYIMDINSILNKNIGRKVIGFDKLNQAMKESKSVVSLFDKIMSDDKASSLFGSCSDNLYKLCFNKASSYYNKLKTHEENTNKDTSRDTEVA